jgi:predicted HAD superfamily hydrolase
LKKIIAQVTIIFGDNSEEKVLMYGKIAITTDHYISKVLPLEKIGGVRRSLQCKCEVVALRLAHAREWP